MTSEKACWVDSYIIHITILFGGVDPYALFLEEDIMSMWYTHGEAGPEESGRGPWSGPLQENHDPNSRWICAEIRGLETVG
jgi:hypothetical protein